MTKNSGMKMATRLMMSAMVLLLAFGTYTFAQGGRYVSDDAWSFGVHGDTQWTIDGNLEDNPNYVSAALIKALDKRFIADGVKFVIQVGDLTDRAGDAALATRAEVAQELYDVGIGFFPLRGNHETFGYLYGNDPEYNLNVPAFKNSFPQTRGLGSHLFGATDFSSPSSTNDILNGLSYSFDYGYAGSNARFMIVDTEQTAVKHQENPPTQTLTIKKLDGTNDTMDLVVGQGYFYILSGLGGYVTGFTVFEAPQDINGVTNTYDSAGNQTASGVPITIHTGEWFRVDSSKRASTNFYAWDIPNPDQMYNGAPFDINDPPSNPANRVLVIDSSAGTEFFPGKQQTWISAQLAKATRGTEHAFVFSHRPLINENHTDSLFGTSADVTPADQNAFYASLAGNDVKYMISGHDHLYNRALDESPDGLSVVEQIITQGASTKFYTPSALDAFGAGIKSRETQISQEVNNFGYYIYTVDGPRVTVDYYSDALGNFADGYDYPNGDGSGNGSLEVPDFNFVKQEEWGYSLNGKQVVVAQGESYAGIADSFEGTTASILAGANNSTSTDLTPFNADGTGGPRPLVKTVNTGWVRNPGGDMFGSNIFSLWGLGELGKAASDVYVLQMTYVDSRTRGKNKGNGGYRLCSLDKNGKWRKAVDFNIGKQNEKFIEGPYNGTLKLGAHGVDPATGTAWAVLDYLADFAVVKGSDK